MNGPTVVILAAGQGTRMRSRTPKVLHDLCGRPMIDWPIHAALEAGADRVVVVGSPDGALNDQLPAGVKLAVQEQALGTGDAVRSAAEQIARDADVIVLSGDVPLITSELVDALARAHQGDGASATVLTTRLADPSGYGRIVRASDGTVEKIVETKADGDATAAELAIDEVNAGIYAFSGGALLDALAELSPHNAQGEYYLPDVVQILRGRGERVAAHEVDDSTQLLGVNDRAGLAAVRALAQRRIHERHMLAGVTIVDPASTTIDAEVELGGDTVIEPATFLRGRTSAGAGCRIGPLTTLIDATLGDEVCVVHSYLQACAVRDRATVGPFAYLRPDAVLGEGAKAGTFVEIKNSNIGANAKVPHLSYIGDADVGEGTNLGATTVTANYDGHAKHRTTIGANVHGGVDTTFVAPVTVGDDAYTAAGSVVTEDVPPGALAVARARQRNVEGYAKRGEQHQSEDQEPPR